MTGQVAPRTDVDLYTVSPSVLHSWSLQATETEINTGLNRSFVETLPTPWNIYHYNGFTQKCMDFLGDGRESQQQTET